MSAIARREGWSTASSEPTLRRSLPPGPRGLPIIGNLHQISKVPHESLDKLAEVYGPIFWLRLGSIGAVVISSPEWAREALSVRGKIYNSRPNFLVTGL